MCYCLFKTKFKHNKALNVQDLKQLFKEAIVNHISEMTAYF